MEIAVVNDKTMRYEELDAVYHNRGTYFGDGVYEVVRSYDGMIFLLDEHLARFGRSLKAIGIEGVEIDDIRGRVESAYEESGIANAKIYFHTTRGLQERNHLPCKELEPDFFMTITELGEQWQNEPVKVITHPDWRWKRCDIKSLNLLANVLARIEANKRGCYEAVLVDEAGFVTEGSGSAFFVVKYDKCTGEDDDISREAGARLITRPLGPAILPSITRNFVTRIAAKAGLEVVEEAVKADSLGGFDEAFLAVTTKDILPVSHIDGKVISDGSIGDFTGKLIEVFADEVRAMRG
jgi:D-alanine transaminase